MMVARTALVTIVVALVLTSSSASSFPTTGDLPPAEITLTCVFYGPAYARRQVDPIVSPGIEASAHSHDFYGRQDISDFMFAQAAWPPDPRYPNDPGWQPIPSSCRNYGDWASYWFPTPKLRGVAISSGTLEETWRTSGGDPVAVPPFGMAFVAGNAAASAPGSPHLTFTCGDLNDPGSQAPVRCDTGTVTAELMFPDCWDGTATLRGDYFPAGIAPKHFGYGSPDCPSGMTRIAQLITRQHFIDPITRTPLTDPLNADGSIALSFASGPYYTYHGDFLNSWGMNGFSEWIRRCLDGEPSHLLSASDTGGCTFA